MTQFRADLMLVVVTICWGTSCLLTKIALEDLQELTLNAIRSLLGFVLAFIVFYKMLKIDKKTIKYSALISLNYFFVLALMTYGVRYTSVSKAGFLTCLAGVFVPLINLVAFKKIPEKKIVFCALTTMFGVYLLTMGGTNLDTGVNIGDLLCVLCSMFFAVQIMLIGYCVKRIDAITLTVFQNGFVGVYYLITSFIFETPHMPTTKESWISVLLLCIFSTVIGMLFQNIAQKYTTDTHAGIIFTLEPVFAVISAYIVLGETLTRLGYTGAIILLACIVLLEVDISKLVKRRK